MKIKRAYRQLIIVAVIVLCAPSASAQKLPQNATVADIANVKEDLSNRIKNIANSESEISEERRWLSALKTSVLETKNAYNTTVGKIEDIDKFKADVLILIDRIGKLDCNKLQDCKSEIEEVLTEFQTLLQDDRVIDVFNEPKELLRVSNKFSKLAQYFPSRLSANPIPFTNLECTKVKTVFSNTEIKGDLNNFIEDRKKEIEKFSKEQSEKIAMLNLVEQEINNYNQKLNDSWQKANTKMSLQTNLYLMILIIGLLSIATIGIVRLFPDTVMREWVESGQVIQFVTVMILLSVIMSLGLAGLLSENTLGTLLGGIGGYVLSQGVGRSAARAALKDLKDRTVPSSNSAE